MTTNEKLERIAAKCLELLESFTGIAGHDSAKAAWRSTIAAIEFISECEDDGYKADALADEILAAWEGLV